jgi:hypothetical protein
MHQKSIGNSIEQLGHYCSVLGRAALRSTSLRSGMSRGLQSGAGGAAEFSHAEGESRWSLFLTDCTRFIANVLSFFFDLQKDVSFPPFSQVCSSIHVKFPSDFPMNRTTQMLSSRGGL